MNLWSIFLGSTSALDDAERELTREEDVVFSLQPGEDGDLGVHVRADIPRYRMLNARARFNQARTDRQINSGKLLGLVGFALILGKLFGVFDLLLKMLGAL